MKTVYRSMLFVPAYKKKFIDNALTCDADALIIDLEDSVPAPFREEARQILTEYIDKDLFKNKTVFVRVNSLESEDLEKDIELFKSTCIKGVMLTKIYTKEDIEKYDSMFRTVEEKHGIEIGYYKFLPLIETAAAVMNVASIAIASERVIALCFGGEDFLCDIMGSHEQSTKVFDYPRAKIAIAARAAGVLPIDTPFLDLNNDEGFIEEETKSFALGYAGALLVHPKQIALANSCFMPESDEIVLSREIVRAVEDAKDNGSGVTTLNGKMVGPPMMKRAKKVLELIDAVNVDE